MLKRLGTWLVDKWLAGFITASIFFLLKILYDLTPGERGAFFRFKWFTSLANTEIEIWKYGLFTTFFLILYRISNRIKKGNNKRAAQASQAPPELAKIITNYTSDNFGTNRAKWVWILRWNEFDKRLYIDHLSPLCPKCDARLDLIDEYGISYGLCSKCRLEGRKPEQPVQQAPYDVEQEIRRRIIEKIKAG
jgi:hypothetical protein